MDRIQLRRDSSARWAEVNPILLEGEVGFETDTKLRKIGDGVHRWNELEYLRAEGIVQESGDGENVVMSQKAVTEKLSELGSEKRDVSLGINKVNQKVFARNSAIRINGEVVNNVSDSYAVSDYIKVDGKNIVSNGWLDNSGGWATYAVYDKNLTLLRTIGNNQHYNYINGDYYVRISFKENLNAAMANYGTELAPYQPYTQNYDFESAISEVNKKVSTINGKLPSIESGLAEVQEGIKVISSRNYPYEHLSVGYYSNDGSFNNSDTYRNTKIEVNDLKGVESISVQLKFPAPVACVQIRTKDKSLTKSYNTTGAAALFVKEILAEEWQGAAYIIIQTYNKYVSEHDFLLRINYADVYSEIKGLANPYNLLEVGKGAFFNYNEVQNAIDAISDDSEDNPYLIIVYPGTYRPFYLTEQRARHISIVGLDKFSTQIICTSGKYADATTIRHLYGSIRNLTFISNYDDFASESEYVSWINTSGNNGAYALHIDGSINSISQKLIVDNCILRSKCNATFGIGLHQDEVLEITNCSVYYEGTEAVATRFHRGVFYCHSYPISSADGTIVNNQNLILANNRFYGKSGENKPLYLAEIEYMSNDQGYCNFEFYNNMFIPNGVERAKQVNLKTTYGTKDFGHYINSASCGNNVKTLNKDIFEQ